MPELPDINVYVDVLNRKLRLRTLQCVRLGNAFLLRSVVPPLSESNGQTVRSVRRIGKRVAIGLENEIWLVLHLMIAGRLKWELKQPSLNARNRLASFDFDNGSLLLTETGTKKRASLHVALGETGLAQHDAGGIEPIDCAFDDFRSALQNENHTLKRALTDPRFFSGIGNAYSDEILHAARLSPVQLSQKLNDKELRQLYEATRSTLADWQQRLLVESNGDMPQKVTAFRPEMSVHGRFGQPCPVCGQPVQRIRYKNNETNYCAGCQTGSRILKDRSLSRLLRRDWPKTLDDLQE